MAIEPVTCPQCGGKMISRQNKSTGQRFWGCAQFPDCKGTRNTDGDAPGHAGRDVGMDEPQLPSDRQRGHDRRRWED